MISRCTSSVPKKDIVFPRLLYNDSRWSQTCRRRSLVLPGAMKVISGAPRCSQTYYNQFHGTPVPVIRDLSNSKGQPECPLIVCYSSEVDPFKVTLHILSDTPGVSQ
jgi:hypothetical protein